MNMAKHISCSILILLFCLSGLQGQRFQLSSPNKKIDVDILINDKISFSIYQNSVELLKQSYISLTLNQNRYLGNRSKISDSKKTSVNNIVNPIVFEKNREIKEHYNQLILMFAEEFNVVFRAYNNGVAYRFETTLNERIKVKSEEASFHFQSSDTVYFPKENSFFSHNERSYLVTNIDQLEEGDFCSLPVLIQKSNGTKIILTETDLDDYPGMWLQKNGTATLSGIYPGYPAEVIAERDRDMRVSRHEDYLAITKGKRTFPWRILAIAEKDGSLLTNQLSFLLAKPLQLKETDWIKPGKVAWDWWNAWNIDGVDFTAGINTKTYKYYIDFAAKYNIEYIIIDEGWYVLGNLFAINPEMDMAELFNYAKNKNVGIIPWVIWKTFNAQLEPALDQFQKWGAVGIKVDFMQRDDQWMVNYYHKIAKAAAERKMLVDFHGAYKPSGLRRAYPNVITREGVKGLEHNKWSKDITPEHNLTIPFIRMVAGPMDYTPGAMRNAHPEKFNIVYDRPMAMGTRCHQLAQYIIYESPLQMLADSPSNYLREPEAMEFLSIVPTVWDETRVLEAKLADYIVMARKNGDIWFIGAMTDGTPRNFHLYFSFLDDQDYTMDFYKDGPNAEKIAGAYKKLSHIVNKQSKMTIQLAPGGGWVGIIKPLLDRR